MRTRVRHFLSLFLIATVAALGVRFLILEDFRVSSDSMFPTLLKGDLVFVSKSAFNLRLPFSSYELLSFKSPARGSVVAFTLPERGLDNFVKRVVAVEGDRVMIQNGVLHVNEQPAEYVVQEKGLVEEKTPWGSYHIVWEQEKVKDYGPVDVPKGHFFALGDNRLDSVDSRTWGPVPYSCLRGKVTLVWLSMAANGNILGNRIGLWVQ